MYLVDVALQMVAVKIRRRTRVAEKLPFVFAGKLQVSPHGLLGFVGLLATRTKERAYVSSPIGFD